MSIEIAQTKDAIEIQDLIIRAVKPEENPDFDNEGLELFYKPNEISEIKNRINSPDYLTLCFHKNKNIVGLITIHKNEKLDQLFVDPAYRNMRVSTKLWNSAKKISSRNNESGEFWVKSSTMAIPVYESFGFQHASGRQQQNGITYYLMKLIVS